MKAEWATVVGEELHEFSGGVVWCVACIGAMVTAYTSGTSVGWKP